MEKLYGISNSGFSFSDVYLNNIVILIKYCLNNKEKEMSYVELQQELGDPSRIRMIIPFLRYLDIIDSKLFSVNNYRFKLKDLFTESSEKFIKCCEIYGLINSYGDNSIEMKKWKQLFNILLKNDYLKRLCINKKEYLLIIKYLLKYKKLNRFEFFVITSFELNGCKKIFGLSSADEVLNKNKETPYKETSYEFSSNVNSYSYIMQILCDFNVCLKQNGYFEIKDELMTRKILEGLL